MPARSTITNIRLDNDLLSTLKARATEYGVTRSELFRAVLAHYMSQPKAAQKAVLASAPGVVRDQLALMKKAGGVLS